ncbi:MAG: TonB-dependent receptor, partial [Gemmatimonadetes bacterium]|nr:TonB-dependent receptor [Gemmatimonadota bacterium]
GPQSFQRTTVRLRAGHAFRDNLRVSANFSFANSSGDFIQQGSNISGVQLGALRTPPDFNNDPYLTDEGLHRSYRNPDPASVTEGRGYDNPFWIANEISNTSNVGRSFGNITAQYSPFNWLDVNYILGADYAADERQTVFPKSSSDFPEGRIVRADFVTLEVDSNLLATATRSLSDFAFGTLTIGQNLNHREFRQHRVNGSTLIESADQLDFTVSQIPNEFTSTVRTDGYFAQGTVDLWDQLYLTAAARLDGSNTFGGEDKRYLYPKASVAWDLSERVEGLGLSFAKVRGAFGIAGKQPDLYSNLTSWTTGIFTDGWLSPNGLESIYFGNEGVFVQGTLGNNEIKPERTTEYEVGADFAVLDNRVSFGVTYYYQRTKDAILAVDVAPSTGFFSKFANAAEFENRGWELTAAASLYESRSFSWDIVGMWGKNDSCVLDLAGTEEFGLTGFTGSTNSVVAPELDAQGNITLCHPIGVFYTDDFIRFGNGSTVGGEDIDAVYTGNAGDVFLAADGYPRYDPQNRVTGDANPDWTASFRNTIRIGDNLRISGLIDIKHGGQMWNGTKGALYFFGAHKETEVYHGVGQTETFGDTYLTQFNYAGPGDGMSVPINWSTWYLDGIGSGFTGPASQFIEDAGFVKLRDITVAYTIRNQDWLTGMGFNSLDVSVSGRNLKTWTDYKGFDPEVGVDSFGGSAVVGRVDEWFVPNFRSFGIDVELIF